MIKPDKNSSKIWRIINRTSRKKQENHFSHQLNIIGKSLTKPIEIVNTLNIHFANIGKQTCIIKIIL